MYIFHYKFSSLAYQPAIHVGLNRYSILFAINIEEYIFTYIRFKEL